MSSGDRTWMLKETGVRSESACTRQIPVMERTLPAAMWTVRLSSAAVGR